MRLYDSMVHNEPQRTPPSSLPTKKSKASAPFTLPTNPIDQAYIAGILDGEGNINTVNGKYYVVRVNMTDREIPEYLATFADKVRKIQDKRPPRLPTYEWNLCTSYRVALFLEAVLPYMRVPAKVERARRIISTMRVQPTLPSL